MKTYKEDDLPCCPHCDEQLDDKAGDYVIPKRIGASSRGSEDQCPHCDLWFSAIRYAVDEIEFMEEEDPNE